MINLCQRKVFQGQEKKHGEAMIQGAIMTVYNATVYTL